MASASTNSSRVSQRFCSQSARCVTAITPPNPCRASQLKVRKSSRSDSGRGRVAVLPSMSSGVALASSTTGASGESGTPYAFAGSRVACHDTNCGPPARMTQTEWNCRSFVISLPCTVTSNVHCPAMIATPP